MYISKSAIEDLGVWCAYIGTFFAITSIYNAFLFFVFKSPAPDDNTFDHNFARIERLLRSHEDPENLPKVKKDVCFLLRYLEHLHTFVSKLVGGICRRFFVWRGGLAKTELTKAVVQNVNSPMISALAY